MWNFEPRVAKHWYFVWVFIFNKEIFNRESYLSASWKPACLYCVISGLLMHGLSWWCRVSWLFPLVMTQTHVCVTHSSQCYYIMKVLSNSLMHTNSLKIRNRVERHIFLLSEFSVHTLIEVNMLISVSGLDGVSSAPGYLLTSSATFATTEDNHIFFMKCQINVGNKPCQLNTAWLYFGIIWLL